MSAIKQPKRDKHGFVIKPKRQARVKVPNTMTLVEAGSVCGQTATHAKIKRYSIQMGLEDNDLDLGMVTMLINEE